MLIRFAVENFLSFKEMTEFHMTAGKVTRHKNHIALCNGKRILKGAFVFGANAGGKTNLIRAIDFAKSVIEDGLDNTNCDKKYFRIDNTCKTKPSVFQFDIFSNGHFYSYGFAISLINKSIDEEWLYLIDDQEECIFLRTKEENDGTCQVYSDLKFSSAKSEARFDFYSDDICNPKMAQTLFLSDVAMRSPDDETEYQPFRDVIEWFAQLTIIFPNSQYGGISRLLADPVERSRLESLLNYFDTGIDKIEQKEIAFEKAFYDVPDHILEKLKTDMEKRLKGNNISATVDGANSHFQVNYRDGELVASRVLTNHGNDDDLFDYTDESDGTQRLFDLIPIYECVVQNKVIIVDELDRSLHTKAVQEFINHFYSFAENHYSQLIATTHDSNIMDLNHVRQDEIWFIERQSDHSSKVYSLNQFNARFDKRIEKDYLIGRYGGIPVFKQLALEPIQTEEGDFDASSCQ